MTRFICEPLARRHDRAAFHCGNAELDSYLHHYAGQDMRRRVAAVFVMVPREQSQRVVGFYTLSSASILLKELPPQAARKLPRYPHVPAILLGRLARDLDYPGTGRLLLLDALARSLRCCEEIAAAVVLVDAKHEAARRFYGRYGFEEVPGEPNRMILPMKTVQILLTNEAQ